MNRIVPLIAALLLFAVLAAPAAAQASADSCAALYAGVAGVRHERLRTAELLGSQPGTSQILRRASDAAARCPLENRSRFGLRSIALGTITSYSTRYPLDRNNSSVWSGRGLSSALNGGVEAGWQNFSFGILPTVSWQENRDFGIAPVDVPGYSRFINRGHARAIDLPQRFGDDAYTTFDAGQSYLRYDRGRFAAGLANENLWIGPARRSPLLLSNSAPGYAHAFVAMRELQTRFGTWTAELSWGWLKESEYYDPEPANDDRMISSVTVVWTPPRADGLYLGASRLYTSSMHDRDLLELLVRPYGFGTRRGTRIIDDNPLYGLYARYLMPRAQAEVYVEWAHEEPFSGLGDLLREPDQSQAYALGFQKLSPTRFGQLRLYGELAHLEAALPLRGGRGRVTYYTHGNIPQGHTHRGQILGSWIGPGSDTQWIGLDLVRPSMNFGIYLERVRFDADAYYDQWAKYYGPVGHDAQLALGSRGDAALGALQFGLDLSYMRRYNRSFITLDGSMPGTFTREYNLFLQLEASWTQRLGNAR